MWSPLGSSLTINELIEDTDTTAPDCASLPIDDLRRDTNCPNESIRSHRCDAGRIDLTGNIFFRDDHFFIAASSEEHYQSDDQKG